MKPNEWGEDSVNYWLRAWINAYGHLIAAKAETDGRMHFISFERLCRDEGYRDAIWGKLNLGKADFAEMRVMPKKEVEGLDRALSETAIELYEEDHRRRGLGLLMARMPQFIIIGAARAGTTALHSYLRQNPSIFMPVQKEPNFFSFEGEALEYAGPGADYVNNSVTRIEDYQALFAERAKRRDLRRGLALVSAG